MYTKSGQGYKSMSTRYQSYEQYVKPNLKLISDHWWSIIKSVVNKCLHVSLIRYNIFTAINLKDNDADF